MTLLEHLKNINAKSKEKMKKEPGLWIGMITEDLEHWKNYGITTPAQLDRYFLETDVYEMHKSAYGVKGRHYEFSKMSDDDLKKEKSFFDCFLGKKLLNKNFFSIKN